MKIIGIRKVSYNRKQDGAHVEGVELTYTYPAKNVEGVRADTAFISQRTIEDNGGFYPQLGDEVDFVYNRFGKVAGWTDR